MFPISVHYYILSFSLLLSCGQTASYLDQVLKGQTRRHPPVADGFTQKNSPMYHITVDMSETRYNCSEKFISITIDSSQIKANWSGFDFGSEKLQALAAALSPTDIRIGGTLADHLIFIPTEAGVNAQHANNYATSQSHGPVENFYLTGKVWLRMTSFFQNAGWDLIFDFNAFRFTGTLWDPTNAFQLLSYSAQHNIKIAGFQLGNEPNVYVGEDAISPATLAADFTTLWRVKQQYPVYKNSRLFGPGVTNMARDSSSWRYLKWFLDAQGYLYVHEIGIHHYYKNGKIATVEDFLDTKLMDSLNDDIELAMNLTWESASVRPLRLSETSSCSGGGAPDLSDRYVAGFLWLDKLGLAAKHGVTQVFRQSFWGGHYSLISNSSALDPTPDYYLSLLFKKLILGPVFNVSVDPTGQNLRVYAACANPELYPGGALALYYLNVGNTAATLYLTQFQGLDLDLYQLAPGDSEGLSSKLVKLNGKILMMSGSQLPPMPPKPYKGNVIADSQSFGFVVIPKARVSGCVRNRRKKQ